MNKYEWGVVYRLGRYVRDSGPGLVLIIPIFDALIKINLREPEPLVFPLEVITRDDVRTKIRAKVHYRVRDREKMIRALFATPVAQNEDIMKNTLRETIKQVKYAELISEGENVKLGRQSKEMMDKPTDSGGTKMTDPWGIDITEVEITIEIMEK